MIGNIISDLHKIVHASIYQDSMVIGNKTEYQLWNLHGH